MRSSSRRSIKDPQYTKSDISWLLSHVDCRKAAFEATIRQSEVKAIWGDTLGWGQGGEHKVPATK